MHFWRGIALLCCLVFGTGVIAAQEPVRPPETLNVTAQLVVLDATVLDKAGHVVAQSLTRDDFQIEEDKKPQTIYSFESALEHQAGVAGGDAAKVPLLIFVLDEMNYAYQGAYNSTRNAMEQLNEEKYERDELLRHVRAQPEMLRESVEVLILTHHGFRILVQPTRDRSVLLDRVSQHDPGLQSPYRDYLEETGGVGGEGSRDFTLTNNTLQAMWSLAIQQRSIPGRKVVIWLGLGGPNQEASGLAESDPRHPTRVQHYQQQITNMLVEARITLDVIGPGGDDIKVQSATGWTTPGSVGENRYESNFGFSGYVSATGGQWKNGNDVSGEIQASEDYGTLYYTMSYRPGNHSFDGDFRHVRVTVKGHPEWTVLTKKGYYALKFGGEKDLEHQVVSDLNAATFETMPFSAIGVTLMQVERFKGTDSARFTFHLDSNDLQWHVDSLAKVHEADIAMSGTALGSDLAKGPLASEAATWKLTAPLNNEKLPEYSSTSVIVRVPSKTKRLRFVVRDLANGRMGTVDLKSAAVANAPEIDIPVSTPQAHKPTS